LNPAANRDSGPVTRTLLTLVSDLPITASFVDQPMKEAANNARGYADNPSRSPPLTSLFTQRSA
jgi:hypothetical protein